MEQNHYFFIGSVLRFNLKPIILYQQSWCTCLLANVGRESKKRILCMTCISIFGAFLAGKKAHILHGYVYPGVVYDYIIIMKYRMKFSVVPLFVLYNILNENYSVESAALG